MGKENGSKLANNSPHKYFGLLFRPKMNKHVEETWVVVKIMVPCWIPIIIRHLTFRVPKKGP